MRNPRNIILASMIAAASLASGAAVANAAEVKTDFDPSTGTESIVLTSTNAKAFDGKEDTLKAIRIGSYKSAQKSDNDTPDNADDDYLSSVTVESESAYRDAVTTALKTALAEDFKADPENAGKTDKEIEQMVDDAVDESNPVETLTSQVLGDTGSEKPAWSSALRDVATELNKQPKIVSAGDASRVYPGTAAKTADGSTFTFANLKPGYYIIRDTTKPGDTDPTKSGSIPILVGTKAGGLSFKKDKAKGTGVIEYKSIDDNNNGEHKPGEKPDPTKPPVPQPEKGIDGESKDSVAHKVGDELTYRLKVTVPNTTGYTGYYLSLQDVMGKGLDYETKSGKIVKATGPDGKPVTLPANVADYLHETGGDKAKDGTTSVKWEFGVMNAAAKKYNILETAESKAFFKPGTVIEVTYKATINSDAFTKDDAGNTIEQTYSNNPNDWANGLNTIPGKPNPDNPGDDKTEATLGKAGLWSYKADKTTADPGVKFHLIEKGKDDSKAENHIPLVDNGDGTFTVADKDDATTKPGKVNAQVTVPESGTVTVYGLKGDYTVVQDTLSDGTTKPSFPFTFSMNVDATLTTAADGAKTVNYKATLTDNPNGLAWQKDADKGDTDDIAWYSAKSFAELPQTGAIMGAVLLGGIMVAGGAAVTLNFASRKRKGMNTIAA